MSDNEKDANEIPIEVETEESTTVPEELKIESYNQDKERKNESEELNLTKLQEQLSKEKQNLALCEEKLKRSLADYRNLERKTKSDIENGVNAKIDRLMLNFLSVYDDFVRAKKVLANENVKVTGLESILKNMNALLSEYGVTPINALGEIFDPNLHEAISVVEDPALDDGTITKEIRKGYISQNRVVRPSIVEISKKSQLKKPSGE